MKFITSLLFAVFCISYASARLSGEQKELLQVYGAQCSSLLRVSDEGLKQISEGDLDDLGTPEQCWLECIFERLGILNDGQIQTSAIMAALMNMGYDMNTATTITFECENPEGINACERAYSLAKCYKSKNAALHHKKR